MTSGRLEKFKVPVRGRRPRHFTISQAVGKWSKAEIAFSFCALKNPMEGIFQGPHKLPRRWNEGVASLRSEHAPAGVRKMPSDNG